MNNSKCKSNYFFKNGFPNAGSLFFFLQGHGCCGDCGGSDITPPRFLVSLFLSFLSLFLSFSFSLSLSLSPWETLTQGPVTLLREKKRSTEPPAPLPQPVEKPTPPGHHQVGAAVATDGYCGCDGDGGCHGGGQVKSSRSPAATAAPQQKPLPRNNNRGLRRSIAMPRPHRDNRCQRYSRCGAGSAPALYRGSCPTGPDTTTQPLPPPTRPPTIPPTPTLRDRAELTSEASEMASPASESASIDSSSPAPSASSWERTSAAGDPGPRDCRTELVANHPSTSASLLARRFRSLILDCNPKEEEEEKKKR